MDRLFYAHSKEGEPKEEWQPLEVHLKNVAEMAQIFANRFAGGNWAYLAGLWHDLGKYSLEFQDRLISLNDPDAHIEHKWGRPDHSTAGAQHAFNRLKDEGRIIAYAIAGHHAGLPDGMNSAPSCLSARLGKDVPDYTASPKELLNKDIAVTLPFHMDRKRFSFQLSFFIRMLYSCLTDADFLDTERFISSAKASRRQGYPDLSVVEAKLALHMERLVGDSTASFINKWRATILQYCVDAGDLPTGLYSLTVPTGGGKTLSSLSFALRHAIKHGLDRVIYVIPYTSIIEQNAEIFRQILGESAVLEHHSNFEPREEDYRSRLASENWDAPLVVTTNVQFFESLFGNRSSQCRKIHNIAKSVIILDEAQMLPLPILKPCLEAVKELTASYGATIVLCTATQPALSGSSQFKDGLNKVHEIIPDPPALYAAFKKVDVRFLGVVKDEELGQRLRNHGQVLCVVNTRGHARRLYKQLDGIEGCYHLSALMCPAHRTKVIKIIKDVVRNGRPCRLISTQLIEAGVDIDFPVVYRSIAGIDSVAQAAGRCNREGRLAQNGQAYVFEPEDGLPPGHFRQTAQVAEGVMRHHDDPLALETIEEYFRTLYWSKQDRLDEYHILADLAERAPYGDFPFRQVSEEFTFIKEGGLEPLIIPWNKDAQKLIGEIQYADNPAYAARKAQRFTIQIPRAVFDGLLRMGHATSVRDGYNVLTNMDIYQDDLGLCPSDPAFHEAEVLII